jgi:hypothetical protein
LVLIGGLLPWVSAGRGSSSAWDLPIGLLTSASAGPSNIHLAWVLFPVLLVALPLLTRQPLPGLAVFVIAAIPAGAAADVLGRVLRVGHGTSPGAGLFLTLIGGALIAVDPATIIHARLQLQRQAPRST